MNKITLGINHKSTHDDIWQDIIDYKNGTTLRFICNDAIYTGILIEHEEKGNDSWFILENYIVEEDNTYYKSDEIGNNCRIAINLKNVKRVELYYGNKEKPKLRKWLEKNKFFGRFFKNTDDNQEQDDN